jgi:hypothetical protein
LREKENSHNIIKIDIHPFITETILNLPLLSRRNEAPSTPWNSRRASNAGVDKILVLVMPILKRGWLDPSVFVPGKRCYFGIRLQSYVVPQQCWQFHLWYLLRRMCGNERPAGLWNFWGSDLAGHRFLLLAF